jgi:hypothetical protein
MRQGLYTKRGPASRSPLDRESGSRSLDLGGSVVGLIDAMVRSCFTLIGILGVV